jgi:hypothetical protein
MTDARYARFMALHDRLKLMNPGSIQEAKTLAATLVDPRTATPEEIWRVIWDKPLFANARVSVAKRWRADIAEEMEASWKVLGADPAVFTIRQVRPGVQRDCFKVEGALAVDFVARHRIALHRLYRIQSAATAVRRRAACHAYPFADLVGLPLAEVVPVLQKEFGAGWGVVTVLHALTDMGLAVKPDLHLVNTMRALELSNGLAVGRVPDFRDAIRINEDVRHLLTALGRADTPSELRYIDKVLMDISYHNLLLEPANV